MLDAIKKIIEKIDPEMGYSVGLRGLYESEESGKLEKSYVWVDGEKTGEELPGTCTIGITDCYLPDVQDITDAMIMRAIKKVKIYGDGKFAVVIGNGGVDGEDAGELIIRNAQIIGII